MSFNACRDCPLPEPCELVRFCALQSSDPRVRNGERTPSHFDQASSDAPGLFFDCPIRDGVFREKVSEYEQAGKTDEVWQLLGGWRHRCRTADLADLETIASEVNHV